MNLIVNFYQFNPNFDGEYIIIQEIDSNGTQKLIANLTGPDEGPNTSNWDKKTISISTMKMNIEFISDGFTEYKGFSANIYFTPIPNIECQSWLDMNKKIFKSPNYPELFHNTKKCSWLITVDNDYHITLIFSELHVRLKQIIMTSKKFGLFSLCRFFLLEYILTQLDFLNTDAS